MTRGMFVLGVTGGIGSGKSTVASSLAARGARVLDADGIVRDLYAGGEIAARIGQRFGPRVIAADGSVDRAELGRLVFGDARARRALERIVHPAVRRRVESELAAWRREGFTGIVVVDAALLVESDYDYPLDALLVVTAEESVRLDRLEARGTPREEARRRMSAQAPDAEKRARADFVVPNDGTRDDLERELDRVLRKLGRDEAG